MEIKKIMKRINIIKYQLIIKEKNDSKIIGINLIVIIGIKKFYKIWDYLIKLKMLNIKLL